MCACAGDIVHIVTTAALLPCVVIHTVFFDSTDRGVPTSARELAAPQPHECDLPPLKEVYYMQQRVAKILTSHLQEPLAPVATPLSRSSFDELTELGAGPFGTVKLVQHKVSGQRFALKIIEKASIPSVKLARQAVRERDIMQAVYHPFVATCFGSFHDDRHVYLVSEYLHGGNLYQHFFDTPDDATTPRVATLDLSAIRFYAANMVKALQGLHDHGIIYRDLKLDNMMLDSLGYVKLIDMGFAKDLGTCCDNNDSCEPSVGADKRTMTLCGTPEYMAPEILSGKGYGMAVDFWALGAVLYEIAMGGDSLFFNESHARMMSRIKAVASIGLPTTPAFAKLDSALQSFIVGLLAYDPTKRLGCTAAGFSAIEDHPFFRGFIDWNALVAKQLPAPFVPDAPGDNWPECPPDVFEEDPLEDEASYWGDDDECGGDIDPKVALVFQGF